MNIFYESFFYEGKASWPMLNIFKHKQLFFITFLSASDRLQMFFVLPLIPGDTCDGCRHGESTQSPEWKGAETASQEKRVCSAFQ